jgi:thiol-disulfide isomerase/thioredoxin
MDRLHALIATVRAAMVATAGVTASGALLCIALAGCDDDATASGTAAHAPPGRVVSVAARPEADPAEGFCEAEPSGADAPALALPELATGRAPSGDRVRWVNVWATWCAPCVEELPLLVEWRDRLRSDGVDVDLVLLSADGDQDSVDRFYIDRPYLPASLRVTDPTAIAAWAGTVGLDEGATLPIHVMTGPSGRVSCARTGAVRLTDYNAVQAVLSRP